jgi:hypothetical protein
MTDGPAASRGRRIDALTSRGSAMELGSGRPDEAMRPTLAGLTDADLFGAARVVDRRMAQAVLSGLWLYHDFLEESHRISQSIETATGSYWHGIMHRREGDYGNAKYWFRRVGRHPIEEALCVQARALAHEAKAGRSADFLAKQSQWDHFRFVDLVEESIGSGSAAEELCRGVQEVEWRLLFDHSHRMAVGE